MVIYLIRHAETVDNINHIIQSQSDSPLTEVGILKAKECFKYFADKQLDRIISSPIGRAKKTAYILCDAIKRSHKCIRYDEGFKEINLGKWTKVPKQSLLDDEGLSSYRCYKEKPQLFSPREGESLYDLQLRVTNTFNVIVNRYKKFQSIAIVSHNVALCALLLSIIGKPMETIWDFSLSPASIVKIDITQGVTSVEFI